MGVRLPPEYQEVDWIGSNNDAYLIIKGKVTASEAANLKVKTTVLWQYVLPRQIHGRNGRCYFGVVNGYYQNTQTGTYHTQIEAVVNEWTSVEWSRNNSVCTLKVGNDIDITDASITATDPESFALFALGDGSIRCYCKLKETQVEIGDEQFDLIPCYRKADSKPGMYDPISGTLFTNAGAGEFLVGPDVIDSISPWLAARRRMLMKEPPKWDYVLLPDETGNIPKFVTPVKQGDRIYIEWDIPTGNQGCVFGFYDQNIGWSSLQPDPPSSSTGNYPMCWSNLSNSAYYLGYVTITIPKNMNMTFSGWGASTAGNQFKGNFIRARYI